MLLVAVPVPGDVVANLGEDGGGLRLSQRSGVLVGDALEGLEFGVLEREADERDDEAVDEEEEEIEPVGMTLK